MANEIEFEVIGIAELLKRNKLVVPPNQREYSWLSEVQVRDLLQDISNAMRGKGQPYYLGTVVLTKGDDDVLEIADGQQRLATTTMILASIRDWYSSKGDTMMVQSIENDFLFTIDRKQRERVARLTLNLDDNNYFINKIVLPKRERQAQVIVRRSHRLIENAQTEIRNHLELIEKQSGEQYTKDHLNEWVDYLAKNAKVVKLVVMDDANAFIMFETLNDRGLKVSQADLVKNYLFKISDNRLGEAQKLWSSMKAAVESIADDDEDVIMDFLRAACCILYGATTKKEVMNRIKSNTQSKTESIQILTTLEELSKFYAAVHNPEHQKWNDYDTEVRKSIEAINLFGVTQVRPLMLAVARYFNKKNTAFAFKKLVSWSVRFIVMGIRGGRLDDGYAKLSNLIYLNKIKDNDTLKDESENIVIKDAEFKKGFQDAKIGVSKLARYYLRSLENTAREEANPEFIPNDGSAINLEHIIPESPGNGWDSINSQDVETHYARLGNMVLLQAHKNAKLGNDSFQIKRQEYKNSNFLLTSQVGELSTWNIEEVEKRQKLLAELAVKTWPL